ncbi:MAG: HNH endonuclease [Woeseiaceae bacterium]|nr:HNH endonuclease [Woeseiaceae bacterium]
MPIQAKRHRAQGWKPPKVRARRWEKSRPNAAERGYTAAWRRARDSFLIKHPVCRMCQDNGKLEEGVEVDHIIPHRGNMKLFWDETNWQALCRHCHSSVKQRLERAAPRPD